MRELLIDGEKISYELKHTNCGNIVVNLNGNSYTFKSWKKSNIKELMRVEVNGNNVNLWKSGEWTSVVDTLLKVKSTRTSTRNKSGSGDQGGMLSPMPGKILKIIVKVGDNVKAGQGLLVMEAMKMEHTIKADSDGVVEEIHCMEGGLVDGGVELVKLNAATQLEK